MIPESYYKEKKVLELTESEMDRIIEELERAPHNLYEFYNYGELVDRLKVYKGEHKTGVNK